MPFNTIKYDQGNKEIFRNISSIPTIMQRGVVYILANDLFYLLAGTGECKRKYNRGPDVHCTSVNSKPSPLPSL